MNKESYELDVEIKKITKHLPSFDSMPSIETEEHHVLGRKMSDETITLPKNWHRTITAHQNSLSPKQRHDWLIFALMSIVGLLDLIRHLLLIIIARLKK